MSDENLHVKATFTASNRLSPVLHQIIGDIKKLQSEARKLNATFSGMGNAGIRAMTSYDAATKAAVAQARGLGNTNSRVARDVSQNWRRANDQRLQDSRRLYTSLERMERDYQRQLERRVAAERRAERHAGGRSGSRLNPPSIRSLAIGSVIAGAGVASSFRKRIETEAAETRAQIFGELSKAETQALRKSYADKAGIKYGVGSTKALDVATEGLKAGIAKEFAGQFGELILKAQAGLDIDTAATAKFAGRLATIQNGFDYKNMLSVLNATAVANNATAADGNEIIEATRRSLSAMASTKMTAEQLVGLNATGISLGIQPFKMGTFVSFLTSELASAASARGQRAKDLNAAANSLGFGGRTNLARSMQENPMETISQILEGLSKLPDSIRAKVARQIGLREWSDELLSLVLGRGKLKEVQKDITDKPGFLNKTSLQKIQSLQGRWASISATAGLVWEKVGGGLETMFRQISDAIIKHADTFNFDSIRDHVSGFVDGLRDGLGLKSWGELVDNIAGYFKAGAISKWKAFGKGLAEGVNDFIDGVRVAATGFGFLTGNTGSDPKSIGKMIGHIGGLTVALSLLSPVIGVLSALSGIIVALSMSPIGRFVMGFGALMVLIHRGLSYVSDKIFAVFVGIVDAVKSVAISVINKIRGWVGLAPISSGGGASGSWSDDKQKKNDKSSSATDFSGSRKQAALRTSIDSLTKQVASFGANVERVSLTGYATPTYHAVNHVPATGGNPLNLFRATPGMKLPNFGVGRGGIIRSDGLANSVQSSIGGIADRARSKVGVDSGIHNPASGAGLSGSKFLAARRARFAEEMKNDPALREQVAGMMLTEGAKNPLPVVESLMNRMDMRGWSLKKGLFGGFYGPINRGELPGSIRRLRNNPKLKAKMDQAIDDALNGSNVIKGYTDQGLPTDPNGSLRGGRGRPMMKIGGNEFLDWGAGSWQGKRGHAGSQAYREWLMRNVENGGETPINRTPAAETNRVIASTPSAMGIPPSMIQRHGDASLRGNNQVSIHINGNSHDPEALATLVQRRIDESMNWRTHDTASEYT